MFDGSETRHNCPQQGEASSDDDARVRDNDLPEFQAVPPRLTFCSECLPFLDRVVVAHREIAAGADGSQVFELQSPPFALGYIVTHVEVKDGDDVLTPRNIALVFIDLPQILEPDLFSHGLGDLLLSVFFMVD